MTLVLSIQSVAVVNFDCTARLLGGWFPSSSGVEINVPAKRHCRF